MHNKNAKNDSHPLTGDIIITLVDLNPSPLHPPVNEALRFYVSNDVTRRSLVLVELLCNEYTELHAFFFDQSIHPGDTDLLDACHGLYVYVKIEVVWNEVENTSVNLPELFIDKACEPGRQRFTKVDGQ